MFFREIEMKKNENGRSMIEILGVLAIIGVLSAVGIYGYTIAMRRHRANEIVQTASMLATLAKSANAGEGACLQLSKSGLGTEPAGIKVEMVASIQTGANERTTVDIQILNNMGNSEISSLCDAINNIPPSNDTRSGYVLGPCGAGDLNLCN